MGGVAETGEGGWLAAVGLRFLSHLMLKRVAGWRTTDSDCESAKRATSLPELVSPEIFDPATASRRLRLLSSSSSVLRLDVLRFQYQNLISRNSWFFIFVLLFLLMLFDVQLLGYEIAYWFFTFQRNL